MIREKPAVKHLCTLPNMVNIALISAMILGTALFFTLANTVTSLPPPGSMVATVQAEARAVILQAVKIDFSQAPSMRPDPKSGENRRIIVIE